jgi:hypothetical protein
MVAGTSALLVVIGGGAAGIAALTRGDAKPRIVTTVGDAAVPGAAAPEGPQPEQPPRNPVAVPTRTSAGVDRAASRNLAPEPAAVAARSSGKAEPSLVGPAARPAARPVITTRTDTETREIPYASRTVRDPGLPIGSQQVQTPGVAGEETVRYLVTLTDGKQTARRLLDSTVTRQPQQEVVAVGDDGDKTDKCGATLDFCGHLSRDTTCRYHRRDESGQVSDSGQLSDSSQANGSGQVHGSGQVNGSGLMDGSGLAGESGLMGSGGQASGSGQMGETGQIGVDGNDLALLAGGHGGGLGGGLGGGVGGGRGGGGRGHGC